MSSLSQQLKAISEKNASVALDRKSRTRIHQRSLIFDPKVAALQDYDYLHQIGQEALAELVEIDSRFARFSSSLFADSSVSFDRNVQSEDVLVHLTKNIDAFINLVAPHYTLAPSLRALEWLVRRYHANIHNAETLLLSALPYHAHPVFTRFMNVVPAENVPNTFAWMVNFKEQLKCPPPAALLKCFCKDKLFYTLYADYLKTQVRHNTAFKAQLVFFMANTVQIITALARNAQNLNDNYIPVVLESASALLSSSENINSDARIAVYAVLSVLATVASLTNELLYAFTKLILQNPLALNAHRKETLVVLGQLWHYYDEADVPASVFAELPESTLFADEPLLHSLMDNKFNISRFMYFYFVARANAGRQEAVRALDFVPITNDAFFKGTTKSLVTLLASGADIQTSATKLFKMLHKHDERKLANLLAAVDKTIADLELLLMYTLKEAAPQKIEVAVETKAPVVETKELKLSSAAEKSFLTIDSSDDFHLVLKRVSNKQQLALFIDTLNKDLGVSFLLRLALTPSVLLALRLAALAKIRDVLQTVDASLYLLAPSCLLGASDTNKAIREAFLGILKVISEKPATKKAPLFLESQIYGDLEDSKKSLLSATDANNMMSAMYADSSSLPDLIVDGDKVGLFLFALFNATRPKQKHFGLLIKTFILTQWSVPALPLVVKQRAWRIIGGENVERNGVEERFFFAGDFEKYVSDRLLWQSDASRAGLDFANDVETVILKLIGGESGQEKGFKEISWLLKAMSGPGELQLAASKRLAEIFDMLKSSEQLGVCTELIDTVVRDSDVKLEFDPIETLQSLRLLSQIMVELLATVNIVTQIPEQGLAKRRRRSSLAAQRNMAKDDISSMATSHLKKLSIVLDVLENCLRKDASGASGVLLQSLFKILTDLDYLGNDGKMPVLYAQETLATCMLLCIVLLKNGLGHKKLKLDSNTIRGDLIVNSIRNSQSPQVQNRLLLVIAELASLAPEIILHSVMPIFTFMGTHTVKQEDEFSSSALQQTIAKVIPAIMSASDSIDNEIEFLLASFITAFPHVPRHRRTKLFASLIETLGCANSLHSVVFLIAQQYSANLVKGKAHECESLLEFVVSLFNTFSANDCLNALQQFLTLWMTVPSSALASDSDEYDNLSKRPIFGTSIAKLGTEDLSTLRVNLLQFLNDVFKLDNESNESSLKLKFALVLFDELESESEKEAIFHGFNNVNLVILGNLESATGAEVTTQLFEMLKSFLNLLPLTFYIASIMDSLVNVKDDTSTAVAKNFAILAGSKFESEVNANSLDEALRSTVLTTLMPTLVTGVKENSNVELVQAYLDTIAVIVTKLNAIDVGLAADSKFLLEVLKVAVGKNGFLNGQTEIVVSSIGVIVSIIDALGVKAIGFFPQVLPPALKLWETTSEDLERNTLLQGAVLMLVACLVRRLPAFVLSLCKDIFRVIFLSNHIDSSVRSNIALVAVEHLDKGEVLSALCDLALHNQMYATDKAKSLGLYLSAVKNAVEQIDKKAATANSSLFMRWLIKLFEFREEHGEAKFSDNTIHSIEGAIHQCAVAYVMKLNDKSFRPLFASLVRWAATGEGAYAKSNEVVRLTAFFRFFRKMQESLRSIVTMYFSYLLDPTVSVLNRFASGELEEVNLRRLVLHSLTSAFKYDQDDYWSNQLRFETILEPLFAQLGNIEESIGKYLMKALAAFVTSVSSDDYNDKLVQCLVQRISNEHNNSLSCKIWTVRVLKSIFQQMGEQWLPHLPTFIPYIAELLEDDDENVEMEVRKDLVRVIEDILGEPLERYLS